MIKCTRGGDVIGFPALPDIASTCGPRQITHVFNYCVMACLHLRYYHFVAVVQPGKNPGGLIGIISIFFRYSCIAVTHLT